MGERRLTFRGGRAMALVPFAIFIIITIGLSFANFQDINAMVAAGVIALLIGMLFSKDLDRYWDVILKGLGSKVAMTAVMLWLVVGMYGAILKRTCMGFRKTWSVRSRIYSMCICFLGIVCSGNRIWVWNDFNDVLYFISGGYFIRMQPGGSGRCDLIWSSIW